MTDLRILFLGDIFASPGRQAVADYLPEIRNILKPHFVIANGENSAHGFGMTSNIYHELLRSGIDVITGGNHIWDNIDIMNVIDQADQLVRPLNLPENTAGRGYRDFSTPQGTIRVINALGKLFMEPMLGVWEKIDEVVPEGKPEDAGFAAIFIDFHAEASSEKMALANALDGRVSAVIGTHTHVPTADGRILPKGTAYQTDAGMCGVYDSVIGMEIGCSLSRFKIEFPRAKLKPAKGEGMLTGVFFTVGKDGLATNIAPVRYGNGLSQEMPDF